MNKWVLFQSSGPGAGKKLVLTRNKTLAGRGREAEIRINDTQASRKHARFESHPDGVLLKDLKSANGTFCQGKRIKEKFLRIGDSFSIGKSLFHLVREAEMLSSGDSIGIWTIKKIVRITQVSWHYTARQKILERDVELELLRENFTRDKELTEFARSVLRKAASSNDPSILPILDHSQDNGSFLIARRLTPLEQIPWQTLDLRERSSYLTGLIRFLADWSERGINVPLTLERLTAGEDNQLLLRVPSILDLYILHNKLHVTTPWYLSYAAPEEFLGAKPAGKSEIYRLGVLLYRALTNRFPHAGKNRAEIETSFKKPVTPPSTFVPFIPQSLNRLLLEMLSNTPEKRPSLEHIKTAWSSIRFPARNVPKQNKALQNRRAASRQKPRPADSARKNTQRRPAPQTAPRTTGEKASTTSSRANRQVQSSPEREIHKQKRSGGLAFVMKTVLFLAAQTGIFFLSSYIVSWLLEQRSL